MSRLLRPLRWAALLSLIAFVRAGFAADAPRPVVGPGATRDEVIEAYGWPAGQSRSGNKEILNYPQGTITLENGHVERMDFSPNVPWPAPRPRPAPPSATSVKKPEAPVDFWVTDFAAASQEAARRHSRILALFTGSDWSPASIQFHNEVEFHADFVNAFAGDFVFLRLDFPTRAPQSAELRHQNAQLRERYGVTTYPSLVVLSPAGTAVARVDLTKPQPGATYRDRVIAAVRETRDVLVANPPPPDPEPAVPPPPAAAEPLADRPAVAETPAAPAPAAAPANPTGENRSVLAGILGSARTFIMIGIALGVGVAGFLLWLIWRRATIRPADAGATAVRISDAASGLPRAADVAGWSRDKLRAITAGLAEADGYLVAVRPGADGDLGLQRAAEANPSVLVRCVPGSAGIVSAKRVREFVGTLMAEGVAVGWLVGPAGFAADARTFAEQNGVLLMDTERLLAQIRDLPPLILPRVLNRQP